MSPSIVVFLFAVIILISCCILSSQASRVNLAGHSPRLHKGATREASSSSSSSTTSSSPRPPPPPLSVGVVARLEKVRDRGVEWLLSKATDDYGWASGDTARVVIALASSVEDWPAKNDLVARLIVKQLEIELLEKLLRRENEPLTPAKVAFFALALGGVCKDPHNFYGHSLLATLDKHHDTQDFPGYPETFGYSFTSLVSCLAGSHLHKKRTRHLLHISLREAEAVPYYIDTRGIALLALECIRNRKKGDFLPNHMHKPLEAIGMRQEKDGSFGNVHSTAIAIQTLAASGLDFHPGWNKTSAVLALENSQEPNGSFLNEIVATTESLLAASALLNGLGVLGLTKGHCNSIRGRRKNKNKINSISSSPPSSSSSSQQPSLNCSSNYASFEALHQKFIKEGAEEEEEEMENSPKLVVAAAVTNFLPGRSGGGEELHANNNSATAAKLSSPPIISSSLTTITTTTTMEPTASGGGDGGGDDVVDYKKENLIPIQYWLWIGPHPLTAIKHNLTLQVPANTTFFFVMQRAAELDSAYEFSAMIWPNGHYIHGIAGQQEQTDGYHYWLLYLLSSDPKPENPPDSNLVAPAGVDDLRVEQDQVYLFWYKAI